MKKFIGKITLLLLSSSLFSFATKPGGEGFEIFLNNQLLVQKFGANVSSSNSIDIASATANDQLVVKYYHCGQAGKNRVITIRDEQDHILKEFHYTDQTKPIVAISVPLKDIMPLKKGHTVLRLYYSSTELPKGRMLAYFSTGSQRV